MRERPILFSSPMVRAILAGTKTQTRRIVKPQPVTNHRGKFKFDIYPTGNFTDDEGIETYWHNYPLWGPVRCPLWGPVRSPYGKSGDHLWVRESFRQAYPKTSYSTGLVYREDAPMACGMDEYSNRHRWKPSIHMPRWASRITLENTGVRMERLQDISYEDALAEGVQDMTALLHEDWKPLEGEPGDECARRLRWPQRLYKKLWESINGPGSWDANPFCWVIEFKRIKP